MILIVWQLCDNNKLGRYRYLNLCLRSHYVLFLKRALSQAAQIPRRPRKISILAPSPGCDLIYTGHFTERIEREIKAAHIGIEPGSSYATALPLAPALLPYLHLPRGGANSYYD